MLFPITFVSSGETPLRASQLAVDYMSQRVGGLAGVIVMSKGSEDGTCQVDHYNTRGKLMWASISNGQLRWGADPGEESSCPLDA